MNNLEESFKMSTGLDVVKEKENMIEWEQLYTIDYVEWLEKNLALACGIKSE